MSVLKTAADTRSEAFRENNALMREAVADLRTKLGAIKQGGGAAARDKHIKLGKLMQRYRIRVLLDVGSPYIVIDGEPFWGSDRLDQVGKWLETGGW